MKSDPRAFWKEIIEDSLVKSPTENRWDSLKKVASFRPTIYIGLGGFGTTVVRKLKKHIQELIPDEGIRDGFAFIGLDTHVRDQGDILTPAEYVDLSIGITPYEVAKDPEYSQYLGWFKEVAGNWPAMSITGGADKVRAIGRIAFLFPQTLDRFHTTFSGSLNKVLGFRSNFNVKIGPKVYIITSLAGGTGSGMFLDVFMLVNYIIRSRAVPHYLVQSIMVTPEPLETIAPSVDMPDFYTNTYAALKEMFHFLTGNKEQVAYSIIGEHGGRIIVGPEYLPATLFLLTDKNEENRIIPKKLSELGEIVVSYLLFEVQTPLEIQEGQPKPQDQENTFFTKPGKDNMPRAISSIGVVRFGIPYDLLMDLYSYKIIHRAISEELIVSTKGNMIEDWINKNNLAEAGADQLQKAIRKGHEDRSLDSQYIDVFANLNVSDRKSLKTQCKSLIERYKKSLEETVNPKLHENAQEIMNKAVDGLKNTFTEILSSSNLGSAIEFLKGVESALMIHKESLLAEREEAYTVLKKMEEQLDLRVDDVGIAASSGWFGRKGRIRNALESFGSLLNEYVKQVITLWSMDEGLLLYDSMINEARKMLLKWEGGEGVIGVKGILEGRRSFILRMSKDMSIKLDKMSDINYRGPGNHYSLINSVRARELYNEYVDEDAEIAIAQKARTVIRESKLLENEDLTDEEWVGQIKEKIYDEIESRFQNLNLIQAIDRFYKNETDMDQLFNTLQSLGSPLYPININKAEVDYRVDWIVATHPSIRNEFLSMFKKRLRQGQGSMHAYHSNPMEVIIYSIKQGYTLHSLGTINHYKSHYDSALSKYEEATSKGYPVRPIHAWPGAYDWDEVIPKPPSEEEAYKWFVVGLAFNHLFPNAITESGEPDQRKNDAFIFKRGSNYYIKDRKGDLVKLGRSLAEAFVNFEDNPEWQLYIRKLAEERIESEGTAKVKELLLNEYVPLLEEALRIAERNREFERTRILKNLLRALKNYINKELKTRRI